MQPLETFSLIFFGHSPLKQCTKPLGMARISDLAGSNNNFQKLSAVFSSWACLTCFDGLAILFSSSLTSSLQASFSFLREQCKQNVLNKIINVCSYCKIPNQRHLTKSSGECSY
jgi:hypothetical protein